METTTQIGSATPAALPVPAPGNYNPVTVTVNDSTGVVFLGVVTLVLLIALLRSESRHRATLAKLAAR